MIIGGADIRGVLGRGGFSTVYEGYQSHFDRRVAVKVLDLSAVDDESWRRFQRECAAMGRLSWHPYVVTVYDSGQTEEGQPFILSEYCGGGSLDGLPTSRGPLPLGEVAWYGQKVANALAAAHELGMLHRDVKPANVLITEAGEPALADFGLSLRPGVDATRGLDAYTPAYAPPEVLQGELPTPAADIYSLGATLAYLHLGRPVFVRQADETMGRFYLRLETTPPDLSELDEGGVGGVIRSMLHRDANLRPDAIAVARNLAPYVREPALQPPVAAQETVRRSAAAPTPTASVRSAPGSLPSTTGYMDALQSQDVLLAGSRFHGAHLATDVMGMPVVATGRNAAVFEVTSGGASYALRCFTRNDRLHDAYRALGAAVAGRPTPLADAEWVEQGVRVEGEAYPVVVMPWIDGQPLDIHIESLVAGPSPSEALTALAGDWLGVIRALTEADVAHGDLQCSNVVVSSDGRLTLIDLDGAWVPGLTATPDEIGHPHYQHPGRQPRHWGREMDAFSSLVVYASILALAQDPGLWRYHAAENLLFRDSDYRDVGKTSIWAEMKGLTWPAREYVDRLAAICAASEPPGWAAVGLLPRVEAPSDATVIAAATNDVAETPQMHGGPPPIASVPGFDLPPPATSLSTPPTQWWTDEAEDTRLESAVAPVERTRPSADGAGLGTRSLAWGTACAAAAGLIAVMVAQGIGARLPDGQQQFSPVILVGMVSAVTAAVLSSWTRFRMGDFGGGFMRGVAGFALGGAAGLAGLALLRPAFTSSLVEVGPTPGWVLFSVWVVVAIAVGASVGVIRGTVRAVASGVAGGLVGGLLGCLVLVMASPQTAFHGDVFYLDTNTVAMLAAVPVACACIAVSVLLADVVTRRVWLTVVEGPGRGRVITVDKLPATVGSSGRSTLVLPGSTASTDLRLVDHAGQVHVEVTGDGVEINGHKVAKGSRSSVSDGDVLRIRRSFVRVGTRADR